MKGPTDRVEPQKASHREVSFVLLCCCCMSACMLRCLYTSNYGAVRTHTAPEISTGSKGMQQQHQKLLQQQQQLEQLKQQEP